MNGSGWKARVRNWASYAALTLRAQVVDDEKHPGSVCVNGIRIRSPRAGALRFLYREVVLNDLYRPVFGGPGLLIVDVGANIGVATAYFATTYPGSVIHAFEPNPEAIEFLLANAAACSGLSRVCVHSVAASGSGGRMLLHTSDSAASMRSSLWSNRAPSSRAFEVETVRLSEFMRTLDRSVDLVKIDTEGGEFDIVDDLFRADQIAKAREYVVEIHNVADGVARIGACVARFENAGFHVTLEAKRATPGVFQDITLRALCVAESAEEQGNGNP